MEIDLKKLRFELGYSQEQLGQELGVTKQQMGRLERGESQLTEDKLEYLKNNLHCVPTSFKCIFFVILHLLYI